MSEEDNAETDFCKDKKITVPAAADRPTLFDFMNYKTTACVGKVCGSD